MFNLSENICTSWQYYHIETARGQSLCGLEWFTRLQPDSIQLNSGAAYPPETGTADCVVGSLLAEPRFGKAGLVFAVDADGSLQGLLPPTV
jgi:hypothetical protein